MIMPPPPPLPLMPPTPDSSTSHPHPINAVTSSTSTASTRPSHSNSTSSMPSPLSHVSSESTQSSSSPHTPIDIDIDACTPPPPPPPPPPPTTTTTLSTTEILTHLLPFLTPVAIPLSWDLGNDAVLRGMFADLLGDPMLFGSVDGAQREGKSVDLTREEDGGRGLVDGDEEERVRGLVGDADVVMHDARPIPIPERVRDEPKTTSQPDSTPHHSDVDVDVDVNDNHEKQSTTIPDATPRPTCSSASRAGSHSHSRSKSKSKSPMGQFSPVDWSKTKAQKTKTVNGGVVLNLSPNAKLVLGPPSTSKSPTPLLQRSASSSSSTPTANPSALQILATSLSAGGQPIATTPPLALVPNANRTYTLPPPMEGSIAALREVSLGTAYTDTYVYGDALSRGRDRGGSFGAGAGGEDERTQGQVEMVMGADAGERMLSPESDADTEEEEEDELDRDEDDDELDGERDERMGDEDAQEDGAESGEGEGDGDGDGDAGLASAVASIVLAGPSNAIIVKDSDRAASASIKSLSSLTSLTSSPAPSSPRPSTVEPAPEAERDTRASPALSAHTQTDATSASASSAPSPVIDLSTVKFGPPRRMGTLRSVVVNQPAGSASTLTASTATLATSASAPTPTPIPTPIPLPLSSSSSQTVEEDEAAVQDMVLMGSQSSQDSQDSLGVGEMDEAEDSMVTSRGVDGYEQEQEQEQEQEREQETTPIPQTPLELEREGVSPSSCSPPAVESGRGDAMDVRSAMGDANEDADMMSVPPPPPPLDADVRSAAGPSPPLFTSTSPRQSQEPGDVDDASFNDDEMDTTSTPLRGHFRSGAAKSQSNDAFDGDERSETETEMIVRAKKELNTPTSVPARPGKEYECISSATPSPHAEPVKSTTAATSSKTSASKVPVHEIVDVDIDIDTDDVPQISFVRTPSKSKKKMEVKKGPVPVLKASQAAFDVISISSGSEAEITEIKPTQTRTRMQTQRMTISSGSEADIAEIKPTQTQPPTQTQTQTQTQRKTRALSRMSPKQTSAASENKNSTARPRPRPIPEARRRSTSTSAKIEIFSPRNPEIVDLTTPVKDVPAAAATATASSSAQRAPPVFPLASTSKSVLENVKKPEESLKPTAPATTSLQKKPATQQPVSTSKGKAKETSARPAPEPAPARASSPLSSAGEAEADDAHPPTPPFNLAKATARIADMDDDDDDAIVIFKKPAAKSAPRTAGLGSRPAAANGNGNGTTKTGQTTRMAELLAAKGKSTSLAATRVRKRKRPEASALAGKDGAGAEVEEEEALRSQPPLKRARERSAASSGTSVSVSAAEKEKGKAKETRRESLRSSEVAVKVKEEGPSTRYSLRSPRKESSVGSTTSASLTTPKKRLGHKLVWPKMANPNFDRFVKCDQCETWYHIGCVGMQPDDVRLDDSELYECPMCAAGVPKEESPVKKISDEDINGLKAPCARPNCLLKIVNKRGKGRKSQPLEEPESYLVEALVGRHKKVTGGLGISYEYLVKWQGYGYADVTVQTLESMAMSNPGPLLETFERQAKAEGFDLNGDDNIVLRDAAEAGWTDDMIFVNPE